MIAYPMRRVMALFHAYEALPHNSELVDLAVKPSIEAELTAWFSHPMRRFMYGPMDLPRFEYELTCEYRARIADRSLSVVQDFALRIPDVQRVPFQVQLEYTLLFRAQVPMFLTFHVSSLNDNEIDLLLIKGMEPMQAATKFLKGTYGR